MSLPAPVAPSRASEFKHRARQIFPGKTRFLAGLLFLTTAQITRAQSLLPTTEGTVWEYDVSSSDSSAAPNAKLSVEIQGKEMLKGKELLRFETLKDGELVRSELLSIEPAGVLLFERTIANGKTVPFNPPQTVLPAPLRIGAKWELDDLLGESEVHEQLSVAAEENVTVPAGSFRAFRLHCEEPWPMSIALDRWFVPGTGIVKEITTTRGPNGRLLHRITAVLRKLTIASAPPPEKSVPPSIEVATSTTPAPTPTAAPTPKIQLELAKARDGEATREFSSDLPNIFVRWNGENLPVGAEVRIVWIAEDVGDIAPPNFIVDQTATTITQPSYAARFTLSRPKDGWAAGKYRIELYLEDDLKAQVQVTIHD